MKAHSLADMVRMAAKLGPAHPASQGRVISASVFLTRPNAFFSNDAICDYPQSGERILWRGNLQASRSHHPGTPSGLKVKRILGKGDLWMR